MKDQFIPCELALELKELNFNEPCFACYLTDKFLNVEYTKKQFHFHGQVASAPLWQQAFDWFREVHGLYFGLEKRMEMYSEKIKHFEFIISSTKIIDDSYVISSSKGYSTYQEARLECLKKLIEIVKND